MTASIAVTVKSFATLREVMDPEIHLEVPSGISVGALLDDLVARFDGLGPLLFSGPGVLLEYVNILKNGRNIHFLAGLSTIVENGDTIALFPPAAGG